MRCGNKFCIYNRRGHCFREEVSLNNVGMCNDCVWVRVGERTLDIWRNEQVIERETTDPKKLWHKKSEAYKIAKIWEEARKIEAKCEKLPMIHHLPTNWHEIKMAQLEREEQKKKEAEENDQEKEKEQE